VKGGHVDGRQEDERLNLVSTEIGHGEPQAATVLKLTRDQAIPFRCDHIQIGSL
jgi:hypothetical protein